MAASFHGDDLDLSWADSVPHKFPVLKLRFPTQWHLEMEIRVR